MPWRMKLGLHVNNLVAIVATGTVSTWNLLSGEFILGLISAGGTFLVAASYAYVNYQRALTEKAKRKRENREKPNNDA